MILYKLANKYDTFKTLFTRNHFEICKENLCAKENVSSIETSSCETATANSKYGEQDYPLCNCKQNKTYMTKHHKIIIPNMTGKTIFPANMASSAYMKMYWKGTHRIFLNDTNEAIPERNSDWCTREEIWVNTIFGKRISMIFEKRQKRS